MKLQNVVALSTGLLQSLACRAAVRAGEPGIAATEQYDFPLQRSDIVERIDRDDVRTQIGQLAVGRRPGNAALQRDVDSTGCSNELLQPTVVAALGASGGGHAPILAVTDD